MIKRWVEGESFIQNGREWANPFIEAELPNSVECPECGMIADQVDGDQLFKCQGCDNETVLIS